MTIGVSGYIDRFFSSERGLPTTYTAQIDISRFLTRKIAARGGLAGTGSVGGDDAEDLPTGSGAPALHGFAGVLYYFTPQSIVSAYAGVDYWAQLTQRAEADAGSIVGTLGLQGAMSSRVSAFVEGGYGPALTRGDDDERLWRVIGRVGVRLKF